MTNVTPLPRPISQAEWERRERIWCVVQLVCAVLAVVATMALTVV